jgi:hypothetical protein
MICGNTVRGAGIFVVRSGTDILIGDPLAVDCAGNSVTHGSILVAQNFADRRPAASRERARGVTDVELVIRGNSVPRGSLYVLENRGTSDKYVQGNEGGRSIRCKGNSTPFVGERNPGWQNRDGRC